MTYQIDNLKKLSKLDLGAGDRLVRVIAKGGKIGKKVTESQGVIIPALRLNHINAILSSEIGQEYLINAVQNMQDSIIRKLVESGKMSIFDGQIETDAILTAMQAENESVRFSKESISKWFADLMKPLLQEKIVEKYGDGISSSKLDQMLDSYLKSFQILAQRQPSMNNQIKAGLIRAMEFLPQDQDDAVTVEIATRLSTVSEASVLVEML